MKTILHSSSRWLFIVVLLLYTVIVSAQEICDNGIDDDGDGLVDFNDDEDCFCGDIIFETVNGDFEDFSCCPDSHTFTNTNGIYCLTDGWGPGNQSSTDYFNSCDFQGSTIVPFVPLPIPSGEGAVGLYTTPNGQESIGVCLDHTMLAGESYDVSFYLGFNEALVYTSPLDVNIIMYGTPTCDDFAAPGFGCLDGFAEWEEIATIAVSGIMDSSWVFTATSVTASLNYAAIAFGVECPIGGTASLYHYMDDITIEGNFLNEEEGDEIVLSGDCIDGVQLEVPFNSGITYQWYLNGIAIAGANTNIYMIPNATDNGMYQVITDDGISCTASPPSNVTINANVLDLSGLVTDVQCLGNDDGEIDLDIDSPNMPYDIQWNNSEVIEDISGLASGIYSVTVTDDNGCSGSESFQIVDPPTVTAMEMGDCNTGVEVSIDEIDPGETYQWYYNGIMVPDATTNPYLVPTDAQGEYYVIITNGTNCQSSNPIDVFFDTSILDFEGIEYDVLCFGDETGWIDIEVLNDNGPYEYEWNTGWSEQDLIDVGIGIYSVTISDSYGCSGSAIFTIEEPSFVFAFAQVTQPIGSPVAQVNIVAGGGVQPFTYAWNNGNDTNMGIDLPPGTYTVIVTDANGCEDIVTFNIEGSFSVLEAITPAGCYNECNGTVMLEVDGPPANYTIVWEDSDLFGFEFVGLCAGDYPYTVADDDGSSFDGVVSILQFDSIEIEAFFVDSLCSPFDTIIISTDVTGGTSPYSYLWSTTSTNDTLFDVTVGMYSLTVTDVNLCVDSLKLEVAQYVEPIVNSIVIAAGCDGEATGAIDLTVTNAVEPISFIWSNGMTTEDITGLSIGEYGILITDGNGCFYIQSVTVGANTGFVVTESITDVSCQNEDDGIIIIDVQNGIEPYTINWSHGPTSAMVDNLAPGEYSVEISDASGCSGSYTYTVELLSTMDVVAEVNDRLCADQSGGSISLTIDANENDYSILWNDGSVEKMRENLAAGNYSLEVIDEFGCVYDYDFEICDLAESIAAEFNVVRDTCGTNGVGSIEVISTSGASPFTYLWENNSQNTIIENLVGGLYQLTITDNNGCELIEELEVITDNGMNVSFLATMPIYCFGDSNGISTIIAEDGIEPYSYWWSTGDTTPSLEGYSAGITYFYSVTDAIGCTKSGSIIFSDLFDSITLTSYIEAPLCVGQLGAIAVIEDGGAPPFEYLWSTGDIADTIQVTNGTYSVTVTDKFGCTASTMIAIDETVDPLNLSLINITNPTASNDIGSVEIVINGGAEPYNILWSNNEMTTAINGLSEGDYSVTVTDNNGCSDSLSINLVADVSLTAMYTISANQCFGDCQGSIVVEVMGGEEPYSYLWSDGSELDSIINLCNGEYELEVTDAAGNTIQSGMMPITSPNDIIVNGVVYDISCLDAQDGSITLDVLGGISPYEFSWDNSAQGDSISDLPSGNYEVVAIDNNGCSETASFVIDDISIIFVQPEILPIDCGDEDYTIELLGDNNYNYPYLINNEIVTPDANNQISGLSDGNYSLSYLINENCEVSINDFTLDPIEDYELYISTEAVLVDVDGVVIISMAIFSEIELSDYSIVWSSINDYSCTALTTTGECLSIELIATVEEDIIVIFIDQYGCESEFIIELTLEEIMPESLMPEIYIPNIISPNSDGSNDVFFMLSNDDQAILQSINIFDRWGNLIFIQEDVLLNQAESWDGTYSGSAVNPGVYIYVVEVVVDGLTKVHFGDVTLVR